MTPDHELGLQAIAIERVRQIQEEGYTAEHDRQEHDVDHLARAGATYALTYDIRTNMTMKDGLTLQRLTWPFGREYWKPSAQDRLKELVKAGALISAAIDMQMADYEDEYQMNNEELSAGGNAILSRKAFAKSRGWGESWVTVYNNRDKELKDGPDHVG